MPVSILAKPAELAQIRAALAGGATPDEKSG